MACFIGAMRIWLAAMPSDLFRGRRRSSGERHTPAGRTGGFTLAQSFDHQVLTILADVTGSEIVCREPSVRLYELGLLDSLKTVELLIVLSDELGVDIAPAEIDREEWATPAGIAAFVSRKA